MHQNQSCLMLAMTTKRTERKADCEVIKEVSGGRGKVSQWDKTVFALVN